MTKHFVRFTRIFRTVGIPHQPDVACNDLPKLTSLRAEFPELVKGGK